MTSKGRVTKTAGSMSRITGYDTSNIGDAHADGKGQHKTR